MAEVNLEPFVNAMRASATKYIAAVHARESLLAGIRDFGEAELREYGELSRAEDEAREGYHCAVHTLLKAKGIPLGE
jgi:hypothetical protein